MFPRLEYLTASRVIHRGPLLLLSATIATDGAAGDAQLYNGLSTNEPQIAHVEASSGNTSTIYYGRGVLLERGLYAVINASTTKLQLTYLPLSRKDLDLVRKAPLCICGGDAPKDSSYPGMNTVPPPPPF